METTAKSSAGNITSRRFVLADDQGSRNNFIRTSNIPKICLWAHVVLLVIVAVAC